MVEEVGVGILRFTLGDGVGAAAEDAHVAQILDVGGFVEQGDGQADEVFAAGQYFSFQILDGVQGVGLGDEELPCGIIALQGDGVRRAADFLVHGVVIGRVLGGVHVEDELANAPLLGFVDGDVVVRDFLGVHNVVVEGNGADGAADAVEGVRDEGFLLAVRFLRGRQRDRAGLVFFKGLAGGRLFRGAGSGGRLCSGSRDACRSGGRLLDGSGGGGDGLFLFIVAHVNVQAQKGGANAYDDPCCAIHNVI